jgi:hypothetical protein
VVGVRVVKVAVMGEALVVLALELNKTEEALTTGSPGCPSIFHH